MEKVENRNLLNSMLGIFFVFLLYSATNFEIKAFVWLMAVPLVALSFRKHDLKGYLIVVISVIVATALSSFWVINYSWEVYFVTVIVFAFFLILFVLITNFVVKTVKGTARVLVPGIIYSFLAMVFSLSPISNYWAEWSMFASYLAPIMWYIGSFGATFVIILFNSIVAYYLIYKDRKIMYLILIFVVVILVVMLSSKNLKPDGREIKVGIIQGNYNTNWEWRNENAKGIIFEHYKESSYLINEKIDLLVWPEYSIADDITKDKEFLERLGNISRDLETYLILGSIEYVEEKNDKRHDIALVFSPNGNLIHNYRSIAPLPFDREVIPGNQIGIVRTDLGTIGILICYEETNRNIMLDLDSDADFFVSLSNTAIVDKSAGPYLVGLYPEIRSAESGKYFLRSTNTGSTKIINPFGKVEKKIDMYERQTLVASIFVDDSKKNPLYRNIAFYLVLLVSIITIFFSGKQTSPRKVRKNDLI